MTTHKTRERGDRATGAVRACRYVPAYQTRCGGKADENGFCARHQSIACGVCGEQAVTECSHTGQFLCGTPLCDACEGFTDYTQPNGAWGFANHRHRRRAPLCDAPPLTTGEDRAPDQGRGGRR